MFNSETPLNTVGLDETSGCPFVKGLLAEKYPLYHLILDNASVGSLDTARVPSRAVSRTMQPTCRRTLSAAHTLKHLRAPAYALYDE